MPSYYTDTQWSRNQPFSANPPATAVSEVRFSSLGDMGQTRYEN